MGGRLSRGLENGALGGGRFFGLGDRAAPRYGAEDAEIVLLIGRRPSVHQFDGIALPDYSFHQDGTIDAGQVAVDSGYCSKYLWVVFCRVRIEGDHFAARVSLIPVTPTPLVAKPDTPATSGPIP